MKEKKMTKEQKLIRQCYYALIEAFTIIGHNYDGCVPVSVLNAVEVAHEYLEPQKKKVSKKKRKV